jgi:hypothetical protein
MRYFFLLFALAACDESSSGKPTEIIPDSGSAADTGVVITDGGADGAVKDCVDDPKTHEEIINACTDAAKVDKNPTLKKLQPDGSLPPLP